MPTRKIEEPTSKEWASEVYRTCRDPSHDPPSMRVFEPGLYEHECPTCGTITKFRVELTGTL